jgi:hypothetical protein
MKYILLPKLQEKDTANADVEDYKGIKGMNHH